MSKNNNNYKNTLMQIYHSFKKEFKLINFIKFFQIHSHYLIKQIIYIIIKK